MGSHALVPAEQDPRDVGKDGKRWFYVGRRFCNFVGEGHDGKVLDIQIPTLMIRRGLFAMDMQLAKQRRKAERKKEGRS